jgi:hypothetical protein
MRWLLLFGVILGVMADLTLLDGEYTHVVIGWFSGFGNAIRNTSASLWGVN